MGASLQFSNGCPMDVEREILLALQVDVEWMVGHNVNDLLLIVVDFSSSSLAHRCSKSNADVQMPMPMHPLVGQVSAFEGTCDLKNLQAAPATGIYRWKETHRRDNDPGGPNDT